MQFDVQLYATTTSAGLQWCFNLVAACSLNTGRCDPHGSECRTKNLLGVQSTFGLGRCGKPRLGKVDEVSLEGTKKPNCLGVKKRESLTVIYCFGGTFGGIGWFPMSVHEIIRLKQHQWAFRTKCLLNQRKGMSTE